MKTVWSNLIASYVSLLAAQPAIYTQETAIAGALLAVSSFFLGRAFARRSR
jgi:hypothetical protein